MHSANGLFQISHSYATIVYSEIVVVQLLLRILLEHPEFKLFLYLKWRNKGFREFICILFISINVLHFIVVAVRNIGVYSISTKLAWRGNQKQCFQGIKSWAQFWVKCVVLNPISGSWSKPLTKCCTSLRCVDNYHCCVLRRTFHLEIQCVFYPRCLYIIA